MKINSALLVALAIAILSLTGCEKVINIGSTVGTKLTVSALATPDTALIVSVSRSFGIDSVPRLKDSYTTYWDYVKRIQIDSTFTRGVRLFQCGGGCINANIINADVQICHSKAVTFTANHMEAGRQVEIFNSQVAMSSNFIEIGSRPSVLVYGNQYGDESIVTMNGDLFVYYEDDWGKNAGDKIAGASEYDIAVDRNTVLRLNNVFRNWMGGGFGKMYTFGVKIRKADENGSLTDEEFKDFNYFSYMLSANGAIMPGFAVSKCFAVKDVNAPRVYINGLNGGSSWHRASGYYRYDYQVMWDHDRQILRTEGDNQVFNADMQGARTVYITAGGKGVLLLLSNADGCGNRAMIRFYRCHTNQAGSAITSIDMVDVPLAGSRFMYDNGISICGFRWRTLKMATIVPLSGNKTIRSARFIDGTVQCTATDPAAGIGWKQGDSLLNIGRNTAWQIKVVPDDVQ